MRRKRAMLVVLALVALSGCGASHSSVAPPTTTTTSTTTTSPTTAPPTTTPPSTVAVPAGGPVPAGFRVQSATFISADQGWVLGIAPCPAAPCTSSMARTSDGAVHWVGVPSPRDGLATSTHTAQSGVSEVRFADPRNGWVFGPDLWSTHNGGSTWSRITVGSAVSQVVALEASAGEVDAVVTDCAAGSSPCPGQLWHSPVGSDQFTQVTNVALPSGVDAPDALSLHARTGYLVSSTFGSSTPSQVWVTTDGTAWSAHPAPCPAPSTLDTVSPTTSDQAFALCSGEGAAGSTAKAVYVTANAGTTFVAHGNAPPRGGDGGDIAAADGSTLAIATSSGAGEIYRSADGGATWVTALQIDDGGVGFGDFGFTTATRGFAVHAPAARVGQGGSAPSEYGPNPATLFTTSDAGMTWHPATI